MSTCAAYSCASTIELQDRFFGHAGGGDTPLLSTSSSGSLEASLFRYSTGVAGVRVSNAHGEVELLPFQGQVMLLYCAGESAIPLLLD